MLTWESIPDAHKKLFEIVYYMSVIFNYRNLLSLKKII